ncbi:DUF4886 domain-containing protein [Sphingomonas quercus]|uniref:PEP-CTERM sorting domain-containing protein n=1 Tax=Sphingomonas quercus TaxID=2842451 RepID=A0ABS6BQC7_9SPHN|nr:PEP-CTERM sorting domain-containing protein [Sphingomonas quercus]MBU3079420.1 PEP-CTERM sorting domain-containing protein [Sphingomonas quercus]
MRMWRLLWASAAALVSAGAQAETILFVGNSFTYGASSAAWHYRPDSVTDLNGEGVGGMPAIFKRLTEQAGLDYHVSLETAGGKDLAWHWANKAPMLDRHWDHVVLQDYSTLSQSNPGDPAELIENAPRFAAMFVRANPAVDISLDATWSRPDLTYPEGKPWHGRDIRAMAEDLRRGYDRAAAATSGVKRVLPVGEAFNAAIDAGIADPDPYDGISYGQVDLWTYDHYHASAHGYYLEALVAYAAITGRDPRAFGREEKAAADLGIAPDVAERLQQVAWETVEAKGRPVR